MSTTSDAIAKIRYNKSLLRKREPFKKSGLHFAKANTSYNENFLKSKFSSQVKKSFSDRLEADHHKQKMFSWITCIVILLCIYYSYSCLTNLSWDWLR